MIFNNKIKECKMLCENQPEDITSISFLCDIYRWDKNNEKELDILEKYLKKRNSIKYAERLLFLYFTNNSHDKIINFIEKRIYEGLYNINKKKYINFFKYLSQSYIENENYNKSFEILKLLENKYPNLEGLKEKKEFVLKKISA